MTVSLSRLVEKMLFDFKRPGVHFVAPNEAKFELQIKGCTNVLLRKHFYTKTLLHEGCLFRQLNK